MCRHRLLPDQERYRVQEADVDGFRFEPGAILPRESNGSDDKSGFRETCSQAADPLAVKLIAVPWDGGPGGYQVGERPREWAEWDDKFRDVECPTSPPGDRVAYSTVFVRHLLVLPGRLRGAVRPREPERPARRLDRNAAEAGGAAS